MANPCVILMDDDPSVYQALIDRLAESAVDVVRVERFADAVRTLQSRRVRLLVLAADRCAPPIDEALPIVRGIDDSLPVIVTTGSNSPDLEKEVRAQKIFYYHIKGFGPSDLELAVESAVNSARGRRAGACPKQ